MNRRELLMKVAPTGLGAGLLLMALPGCAGKKKEKEVEPSKQEEEQYYKQEEKNKPSAEEQ